MTTRAVVVGDVEGLTLDGYESIRAWDVEEGIERAGETGADALVVRGREHEACFLDRIEQARRRLPRTTAIVVLTRNGDAERAQLAIKAGAQFYGTVDLQRAGLLVAACVAARRPIAGGPTPPAARPAPSRSRLARHLRAQ